MRAGFFLGLVNGICLWMGSVCVIPESLGFQPPLLLGVLLIVASSVITTVICCKGDVGA